METSKLPADKNKETFLYEECNEIKPKAYKKLVSRAQKLFLDSN